MAFIGRPLFVNQGDVELMEFGLREGLRDSLIAFRCRAEYKEWALALAEELRLNPTDALDASLVELAKGRFLPSL
jgi:hypothetical protein